MVICCRTKKIIYHLQGPIDRSDSVGSEALGLEMAVHKSVSVTQSVIGGGQQIWINHIGYAGPAFSPMLVATNPWCGLQLRYLGHNRHGIKEDLRFIAFSRHVVKWKT